MKVSIRTPNEFRQTGKLPVAGLPTALDSALEALLTENAVSSWKISAEGRKTTVVLRLVTTTDPDMADFTHPHTATQHFRRKPPSQVRRDQRRAAERTKQNPEASEHSPSGLFQPTPPPTTTVAAHLEMQSENDTQHTYASNTDTDARASRSPDYSAPASSRPCDTDGVSLSRVSQSLDFSVENLMAWKGQSETETVQDCTNQSEKRAIQCGYDLATIRNYVGSLKDRTVQRALRNTNRNNSFKTVVLYKSDNKSKLICETDDFVFVSDCSTYQKQPCTYWLIKQEERHMLQEELEYLRKLQKGKPVDRGRCADHLQKVLEEVLVLRDVTRFYLG